MTTSILEALIQLFAFLPLDAGKRALLLAARMPLGT